MTAVLENRSSTTQPPATRRRRRKVKDDTAASAGALWAIGAWILTLVFFAPVAWMVLTAATEQTDNPLSPALGNPGATDLKPYIVTTVGVGLMMFFALVATAMALIDAD